MSGCRVCGAPLVPGAPASIHGCDACGGSPACTRCGHPRREHTGVAGSRETACKAVVLDEATMTVTDCPCAEYTSDPVAGGTVAMPASSGLFDEPLTWPA